MRKKLLVIIFLLGLSVALLGNPSPSEAGTITVDGDCTLVDAIIAANTDAPSGNCPAGSGDDVISLTVDVQFTEAYPGSTDIGGGQAALPDITSNITIEGNGNELQGILLSFRVAYIASGSMLEIRNLHITGFGVQSDTELVSGGAFYIASLASMIVNEVAFDLNTILAVTPNPNPIAGGVIHNQGVLQVSNSQFLNSILENGSNVSGPARGGAIYNTGTTNISTSVFRFSVAVSFSSSTFSAGGAIYSSGSLNVDQTLFWYNSAQSLEDVGYGGALAVEGPTLIRNSTFWGNFTDEEFNTNGIGYGGALAVNTAESVVLEHVTFGNNSTDGNPGEVIYVISGEPVVTGSIIASEGFDGTIQVFLPVDAPDCFGTITGGTNLTAIGDTSCNSISSGTIIPGTHFDTTLADNGGFTRTLALIDVVGNPAVDANPGCGLLTDQRSYDRDINCDIGAFELNGIAPTATPIFTPTDTLTPTITNTPTDTLTPSATFTATDTFTPSPTATFTHTATATATGADLVVSAVCNGPTLEVTIFSGETPFEINTSGGGNVPVTVGVGTHTILGPDKWDDLTVTEQSGDGESINLGQFKCRTDERPVPLTPAHRSRTTNPFPTFSWTAISNAKNYRVFVFDDKVAANRTVDIRQNSGGPTMMVLSTPLPDSRLFWRVRGRQNRVWSLWSVRFTLFKDPAAFQDSGAMTPVPTVDLGEPTSAPVPTVEIPPTTPTLIQPPNSR